MKLKKNIWLLFAVFFIVILVLGFLLGKKVDKPLLSSTPPAFDWTNLPQVIDATGTILYENTAEYQLYRNPTTNSYSIIIYGSPFSEAKNRAEAAFLRQFSLTLDQACGLTVYINTPEWANKTESEQTYGLSFCNNPSLSPGSSP